jgi:hypothetical protein
MDPAVALVQAYLQLNGYLTVTEFPITSGAGPEAQAVTDIDLIALRFPGAQAVGAPGELASGFRTDSVLGLDREVMDLLICEVKEGKARLNPNLTRTDTLTRTLRRVGCCHPDHVAHHVRELQRRGTATMNHHGVPCRARIVVFAGRSGHPGRARVIELNHVAREICGFLDRHAVVLHATHFSQPALAQLGLLTKLGVLGTGPG